MALPRGRRQRWIKCHQETTLTILRENSPAHSVLSLFNCREEIPRPRRSSSCRPQSPVLLQQQSRWNCTGRPLCGMFRSSTIHPASLRSEEHTSELQSHLNLVCRLLLEKKKKRKPCGYSPS